MRSEHFETYQLGQRWWAVRRDPGSQHEPSSGATEAEALLAMCEQLATDHAAALAHSYWDPD